MRCLPRLRSERLVLHPFCLEDVAGLHALWTAPEVRRYLWEDVVISRALAEEVVASQVASAGADGIGCWVIEVEDALAGFCGFRRIEEGPEIELPYGLRREQKLDRSDGAPGMTHVSRTETMITHVCERERLEI